MRRALYLVTGSTGEYSDRSEWTVLAFTCEEKAKALVERLAAWCDERGCGENPSGAYYRQDLGCPPEDPDFRTDSTGTRYGYEAIELEWCGHKECLLDPDMGADCIRAEAR